MPVHRKVIVSRQEKFVMKGKSMRPVGIQRKPVSVVYRPDMPRCAGFDRIRCPLAAVMSPTSVEQSCISAFPGSCPCWSSLQQHTRRRWRHHQPVRTRVPLQVRPWDVVTISRAFAAVGRESCRVRERRGCHCIWRSSGLAARWAAEGQTCSGWWAPQQRAQR